jgi:TPP-dependent pyruvate/acetoin dehydrogenase alpha subunit
MTSSGEEATAIGSAAALTLEDVVFSQYREQVCTLV